ncbi:MAG: ribosome biogenesis protein [Candidatus Micrarchaeota archaeon]|nr:ribosome biogenesis protein [Candidatus Micrarchaeota archaeon]
MSDILRRLRRCVKCGSFTLGIYHCNELATNAHSPVFKPFERYSIYRLKEKINNERN